MQSDSVLIPDVGHSSISILGRQASLRQQMDAESPLGGIVIGVGTRDRSLKSDSAFRPRRRSTKQAR